jgi:hypothetical protein
MPALAQETGPEAGRRSNGRIDVDEGLAVVDRGEGPANSLLRQEFPGLGLRRDERISQRLVHISIAGERDALLRSVDELLKPWA